MEIDEFAEEYSAKWVAKGVNLGSTRIGVNTGEAIIGNFGGDSFFDYTAYGDAVNIAARLEQMNKQYGSYILAGENTVDGCGSQFDFSQAGEVTVRGRKSPTKIYTVSDDRAAINASGSTFHSQK